MATPRKLHLGCGTRPLEGYENHDIELWPYAVHQFNLEETPYPIPDSTYDEIKSVHVAEHIENFIPMMMECHRILKPRGLLDITVPYIRCQGAIANPLHLNYFDEASLDMFYNPEGCWQIRCKTPLFTRESVSLSFAKSRNGKMVDNPILSAIGWLLWKSRVAWCGGEINYRLRCLK